MNIERKNDQMNLSKSQRVMRIERGMTPSKIGSRRFRRNADSQRYKFS